MLRPNVIESLESRRLLSAVSFTGTGGNDTFRVQIVGADYVFTFNGTPSTMPVSGVDSILIDAGGGNDVIDLDATQDPVTINGGSGDDLIFVAFNGGQLDAITKEVTVNGGPGSDELGMYDDGSPATFNDAYTITAGTFDRSFFPTLTHGQLEVLSLRAQQGNNVVDVPSLPAGLVLNVIGLGGDDSLRLGGTTLDVVRNVVNFTAGAGNDSVVFNDADGPFGDSYTVDRDAMWRTETGSATMLPRVNYSGVQDVTIHASNAGNTINVESSPSGDGGGADGAASEGAQRTPGAGAPDGAAPGTIAVFGNGGADTIRLSPTSGNLNSIHHLVDVEGGAGDDTVTLFDQDYIAADHYAITSSTANWTDVAPGDGSLEYSTVEGLTLNAAGAANNVVSVASSASHAPITINGGTGDESLLLGAGNLNDIAGRVTFNAGGGGADSALIDDALYASGGVYQVLDTRATWGGGGFLEYAQLERVRVHSGNGPDHFTVNTTVPFALNVHLDTGPGADTIRVDESGTGTATTIDGGPGEDVVHVNADGAGFAAAVFASPQDMASLDVGNGGRALLTPGGANTLRTRALFTELNGLLNITDNAVVVDYSGASPIGPIQSLITRGYNGGNWLGTGGITSSAAAMTTNTGVGYAEASQVFSAFPATFGGVAVDATSVLIKPALYGDTNLDGTVNLGDFNRLAANFGRPLRDWFDGNMDFDLDVDLNDFNRLAANFGMSAATAVGTAEESPEEPPTLERLIGLGVEEKT